MIVCNLNNFDSLDFQPDISTRGVGRYRFFMWLENQTVRLVEVTCPLTFPVGFQFMKVTRLVPYVLKSMGVNQST